MNILNLYAGAGGNRSLWGMYGDDLFITAIENDKDIASVYEKINPNDRVIIADAHQYLLEHYNEYDFIWSSPPCPTHSQLRFNIGFKANRKYRKVDAVYPDMKLYEEILLLQHWFKGRWVVENTIPYYEPLIKGQKVGGHIFWANFIIPKFDIGNRNHRGGTVKSLQERKRVDLSPFDIKNKRQILRNCVEPELGWHVFINSQGTPELRLAL